jgi:phosphatidylcholine synthase
MSSHAAARPSPRRQTLAWGVHLLTASGAVFGAAALLAIMAGDLARAVLLMGLTLFIDSVDGTLARRVGVAEVLPGIDGRRLDDIVDYLNFVIVPVVFIVAAGCLLHPSIAALPILASAYGFSQNEAKTEDDFFLGWPSYWNVVAAYLWLLDLSPLSGTLIVALFSIAVFVPIKYIYPSKLSVLKKTTTLGALLWGAMLVVVFMAPELGARLHLTPLSLAYPAYYLALSFWLGGVHRRPSAT